MPYMLEVDDGTSIVVVEVPEIDVVEVTTPGPQGTPGAGGNLTIQDEGTPLATAATTMNFTGAGVTASGTGATKTVNIPGGGSSLRVEDEGTSIVAAATGMNFVGSGVVVTDAGSNEATVTINTGSTPDATTSAKGIVKLANHLGGTADLPVVHAAADVFPVEQYGAVGTAVWSNGQADASTAIEAAIAAAKANGGGVVLFRALNYRVSRTIVVDGDGIMLVGPNKNHGQWMFDITMPGTTVIRVLASGPITGPVLDFTNGSLGRRLFGVGLQGVTVDTGASVGFNSSIGVRLRSVACGHWNFAVVRVGAGQIGFDLTCDSSLAAGNGDNQENIFENITVLALTGAHSGKCIRLGGHMNTSSSGSNTSANWWGLVTCTYSDGGGIDLVNADTEFFSRLRLFRHTASTTGVGMIFRNDPTNGQSFARNITVGFIQSGAGGVVFESNASGARAPFQNSIMAYSLGNSSAVATWGAGATGTIRYQAGGLEIDGVTQTYATVVQAKTEVLVLAVGDETTALTTGTAKVTFRMPFAFTLSSVRASLTTASSSGIPTVDINEGGVTILSTKLTIDAAEKTSVTAATAAVISDTTLADDAEVTIDVDVAGTGAAGLKVTLIGTRA